jgi:hypothetical protein
MAAACIAAPTPGCSKKRQKKLRKAYDRAVDFWGTDLMAQCALRLLHLAHVGCWDRLPAT